jgi:hypothetical protein
MQDSRFVIFNIYSMFCLLVTACPGRMSCMCIHVATWIDTHHAVFQKMIKLLDALVELKKKRNRELLKKNLMLQKVKILKNKW